MKLNKVGLRIPDNWLECRGCSDMVDMQISNLYSYGYCPHCIDKIPNYIPEEQHERYLKEKYGKIKHKNMLSVQKK